jgi:hypothetical protein
MRGSNIQALTGRRMKPPPTRLVGNYTKLTGEIATSSAMQATVRQKSEFECDSIWRLESMKASERQADVRKMR